MSDYQTVIGLVLAAFVLVGVPYLLACLPPKRDPEEESESESERRYREMSQ